jgi:hypothetical protein
MQGMIEDKHIYAYKIWMLARFKDLEKHRNGLDMYMLPASISARNREVGSLNMLFYIITVSEDRKRSFRQVQIETQLPW